MNSCQSIRDELATCLSKSDCVLSGKTGQECLRDHMEELPTDCQAVYKSYVNCRRGLVSGKEDCWCDGCDVHLTMGIPLYPSSMPTQLDMRKRFRGNAPTSARDNNSPGGTTTIGSSASVDEQAQKQSDPSIGLSPDRSTA